MLSLHKQKYLLFLLILMSVHFSVFAGSGTANSNGNWGNPSTWLINGSARVPTCGDTVTIPSGVIITVNTQQNYGCATPMVIIINGTLQFTTGTKLTLPCGSLVQVNAGGVVIPGGGGGSSNYINICGNILWNAGSGNLVGPAALGGSPLPIKLLSFEAEEKVKSVLLSWSTATEVNNDYFTLERSLNGTEWECIGTVHGAGNSTVTLNYTYEDINPVYGLSYYRLRQTDFDGMTSTSDPVAVYFSTGKKNVLVSAGLTESSLTILYNSQLDGTAQVVLSNILGQPEFQSNIELEKGSNIIRLDVPALKKGIYIVFVIYGDDKQSKKTGLN